MRRKSQPLITKRRHPSAGEPSPTRCLAAPAQPHVVSKGSHFRCPVPERTCSTPWIRVPRIASSSWTALPSVLFPCVLISRRRLRSSGSKNVENVTPLLSSKEGSAVPAALNALADKHQFLTLDLGCETPGTTPGSHACR